MSLELTCTVTSSVSVEIFMNSAQLQTTLRSFLPTQFSIREDRKTGRQEGKQIMLPWVGYMANELGGETLHNKARQATNITISYSSLNLYAWICGPY